MPRRAGHFLTARNPPPKADDFRLVTRKGESAVEEDKRLQRIRQQRTETQPGSLRDVFRRCRVGDVLWFQQPKDHLHHAADREGVKVRFTVFLAVKQPGRKNVSDDPEMHRIYRVEILDRDWVLKTKRSRRWTHDER